MSVNGIDNNTGINSNYMTGKKRVLDKNFNNQIEDISVLRELKELRVLALDFNSVSDISSIQELQNLRQLNICSLLLSIHHKLAIFYF